MKVIMNISGMLSWIRQSVLSAHRSFLQLSVIRYQLFIVSLAAIFASCQKDLVYEADTDRSLRVRFDWSGTEDARPAEMRLAVFSDGAVPVQVPFNGMDGGSAFVNGGVFSLIGFNGDTEVFSTRGGSWREFEIYSRPTSFQAVSSRMFATTREVPRTKGTEGQETVFEPEMLWTSAASGVTVSPQTGADVTLVMEEAVRSYTFVIENVSNREHLVEMLGTISGMSSGWMPARHQPTAEEVLIPFSIDVGGDGPIVGSVLTFGHCPGHSAGDDDHAEHMLTLYFELDSGQKFYYSFDVTDTMHDPDHVIDGGTGQTDLPIVIDQLPVPTPLTNGTGLHPSVVEWEEVVVDIDM